MVIFLGYDPRKQFVYDTMVRYFQDPVLYKVPSKDTGGNVSDMYAVRIETNLMKERRFLIVMVRPEPDQPMGRAQRLSELMWTVLQTRNLTEEDQAFDHLPVIRYDIQRDMFEGYIIRCDTSTDEITSYHVEPHLPIKVHLLHRKKGRYEYSDQGTILAAVETYQTLLVMDTKSDVSEVF